MLLCVIIYNYGILETNFLFLLFKFLISAQTVRWLLYSLLTFDIMNFLMIVVILDRDLVFHDVHTMAVTVCGCVGFTILQWILRHVLLQSITVSTNKKQNTKCLIWNFLLLFFFINFQVWKVESWIFFRIMEGVPGSPIDAFCTELEKSHICVSSLFRGMEGDWFSQNCAKF